MVRNHVIHINTRFGMNTTCQELFDILATYASEEDQAWVRKAYDYSASALAGQTLRNGAPRLDWALTMAHILALLHADKTVIAAGFLFYAALNAVQCEDDVVKDVKTRFGQDTADIVRGALRIEQMRWRNGENQHDTFLTMGEDIRVLFCRTGRPFVRRPLFVLSAAFQEGAFRPGMCGPPPPHGKAFGTACPRGGTGRSLPSLSLTDRYTLNHDWHGAKGKDARRRPFLSSKRS